MTCYPTLRKPQIYPDLFFATRKPTSDLIFLHAFPDIQMASTVSWQSMVVGGERYHQVFTPDEIQVDEVEDDDTYPSINSKIIHRGTGKEDDVTTDVQVLLDVVPSSSYPGFVEVTE